MKHPLGQTVLVLAIAFLAGAIGLALIPFIPVPNIENTMTQKEMVATILVSVAIGTAFWFFLLKWKRSAIFVGPAFAGIVAAPAARLAGEVVGDGWLLAATAMLYALALLVAQEMLKDAWESKKVWSHKRRGKWSDIAAMYSTLVFVMAMIWIGASTAKLLGPIAAFALLCLLAIYDAIAVWKTKHMVSMALGFLEKGIIPGIAIKKKEWREFALLGGGDVFFLILVPGSLVAAGYTGAGVAVFLGMFTGLVGLFVVAQKKKFYPALPPMVLGAFAGYLGYALVSWVIA